MKNNEYNFIFETTTVVPFNEIEIINESKTNKGQPKIAYRCRLQESDVRNNNRRIYSQAICESIVNQLAPKANSRSLLMEIDHPMFFSGATDPMKAKQRAGLVEINNCGAILRGLDFKNGQIIGEMETLSGFKGPDLAAMIVDDKVNIGFSLRALGSVKPMSDGTLMVKDPIMPITYDVVSNPSHANARIMEFIPESDTSMFENAEAVIVEGAELELLQEDQIQICEGGVCMRSFISDVVANRFLEVVSKKVKFSV